MGLELAKAFVSIRGDSSGLARDLDRVKASVTQTVKEASAAAAGLLAPLGALGGGFLTQGIFRAGTFEQNLIAFETLLGSAEEAQATLEDLSEFAKKTPFRMEGVVKGAIQMAAFGERGQDLIDTLEILGNAAAGTSASFADVVLVFNQVRGVGKLLTEDFRQLATRGVISMQDLADHFDVTTAKAQEMLSAGQISFEDIRDIFRKLSAEGGRFEDLMRRQSASLLGVFETLQDALNILSRELASVLVPVVKSMTNTILAATEGFSALVQSSNGAISAAFTGATAFSAFGAAIFAATAAAKLFGVTLKGAIIGTGIGAVVVALGAAFGVLVNKIRQNSESMKLLREIGMNLVNAFKPLAGSFSSALSSAKGFFDFAIGKINALLDMISLLTTNWNLTWELMKTSAALQLTKVASKAIEVFNVIKASAIAAAKTAVQIFIDLGKSIAAIFERVVAAIKGFFKGLWEAIKSGFAGEGLIQPFIDTFNKEISKIESEFPSLAKNAGETFSEEFNKSLGKGDPLGGVISTLQGDMDRIVDQMRKEREKSRRDREEGIGAEEGIDQEEETVEEKGRKFGEEAAKPLLEAGRVGFAELGQKVQDVFLKDEDDKLDKSRNKLLEQGNKRQEEIVRAVKDINVSAGLA